MIIYILINHCVYLVCLVHSVGVSVTGTFVMNYDHVERTNINAVQCEGEENNLSECPSSGSCFLGTGAGVKCYNGNFNDSETDIFFSITNQNENPYWL